MDLVPRGLKAAAINNAKKNKKDFAKELIQRRKIERKKNQQISPEKEKKVMSSIPLPVGRITGTGFGFGVPTALSTSVRDKWLDFSNIICKLCSRRFKSTTTLIKHGNVSELHKKNLRIEEYKAIHKQMQDEKRKKRRLKSASAKKEISYPECDWICGACDCLNFARRSSCFGCSKPRGPNSTSVFEANFHMRMRKRSRLARGRGDENNEYANASAASRKMLERMGWSEGKGLGKNEQGRTEPVRAQSRQKNKGLGHKDSRDNIYARYDKDIKTNKDDEDNKKRRDKDRKDRKDRKNSDEDTFFEKGYGAAHVEDDGDYGGNYGDYGDYGDYEDESIHRERIRRDIEARRNRNDKHKNRDSKDNRDNRDKDKDRRDSKDKDRDRDRNERENRNRDRNRDSRDRDRERNSRDRDRDRNRDRDRDRNNRDLDKDSKDKSRDNRDRDRDTDNGDRISRDRNRDRDRDNKDNKDRDRDNKDHKDRDRDNYDNKDRDRDRNNKDRDRERDRDKQSNKDRERKKSRDRDRNRN